ncbi:MULTISPECIES: FAD-containing oxidoreductase [Dyella]|uniref:FAD-containing oxidoreductase n=2 Tax=Dyella TaxID=231454 RepID=A0A4R0YUS2_9GAMM|nr:MULTISPECIES: FAD-containing oxidoreductase [Dyella]TBR39350.1 FAD-containing oxidoreductase [Dyella terrae]TCI13062.1 FAD-containing oxidoreductase [Dyella soli]
MTERFDAIVVGAGQAGPPLAERLGKSGRKVAIIERKDVGGTCVNTGCIPTKSMVASAYVAYQSGRAAEYGVRAGNVQVMMDEVWRRTRGISERSRGNVEQWIAGMAGVKLFRGHARFESPTTLRVGDDVMEADEIFLNVGGRATRPPFPGIDSVPYLDNVGVMGLRELPEHLVIVGGSYIGLEFAQMFRRFGSQVSVVERSKRLLPREDPEIADAVVDILKREGITIHTGAECIELKGSSGQVCVVAACADPRMEVRGSHLLLAVGRQPNTDDLGLERAGVATDERGYIHVDDQCRTSVAGIWAMGDCNGKGAFTHTSFNDYEIVAANVLDHDARRISDRINTYALFIDPPLGRIGLNEEEARKAGHDVLVGVRPMTRVGRAIERGETLGTMKVIVDAATRKLLGAVILGVNGDEAIHSLLDAMYANVPIDTVTHAVHIHPTVAELLPTVLQDLHPADRG